MIQFRCQFSTRPSGRECLQSRGFRVSSLHTFSVATRRLWGCRHVCEIQGQERSVPCASGLQLPTPLEIRFPDLRCKPHNDPTYNFKIWPDNPGHWLFSPTLLLLIAFCPVGPDAQNDLHLQPGALRGKTDVPGFGIFWLNVPNGKEQPLKEFIA